MLGFEDKIEELGWLGKEYKKQVFYFILCDECLACMHVNTWCFWRSE